MVDNNEAFFNRLTRLFRSGPAIQKRIRGVDPKNYYGSQLIRGNYGYRAAAPFGFGRENSPFSVLGTYGILDRMSRYAEFGEMEYCLHGDTKIAVPGGYKTIKELSELYGLDKEFIVYSYDHNKKQIVPAIAKQARLTRHDHAYKVTFDSGKEIIGTSNHRLMKRDGTYCEIGDLQIGESMMPFYRKDFFSTEGEKSNGYRWIYNMDFENSTLKNGWISEHRLIASWVAGRKLKENEVVHHINFNKSDNRPENLLIMDSKEHNQYHSKILNGKKWSIDNEKWIEKFKEKHSVWMKENNPSERKDITFEKILQWCDNNTFNLYKVSKVFDTDVNTIKRKLKQKGFNNFEIFAKSYNKDWKSDSWDNKGLKNPRFKKDITFEKICSLYQNDDSLNSLAKKLNSSVTPIKNRLKENGFNNWNSFKDNFYNHKIAKIEYYGYIPLYDLTVDGYKNFATDTVISHNTPEIATALDIYADETVGGDDRGRSFHIYSNNQQIKNVLDELFNDVLNVEFNLKPWVRNLVKYGDFFLFNEVLPDIGIINAFPIPVSEIEREDGFDPEDPYATRFKWITRGNKYLENWQISHFRIMSNDLFLPYGTSILESSRRIWRQLCHEKGTRVWTDNGWKNIEDIKPKDIVYSYDYEKHLLQKATVKAVSYMGKQPIVSVNTRHRQINVTPNHGLLVRHKETGKFYYEKASNIIPFIHQLILPNNNITNELPTVNIQDVKEHCTVKLNKIFIFNDIQKNNLKKYRLDTGDRGMYDFFKANKKISFKKYEELCKHIPELKDYDLEYYRKNTKKSTFITKEKQFVVNEEFCKFFGFMLGDGWLNKSGFGFALGIDDKQNTYYRQYAKNNFGFLNESYVKPILNKRGGSVSYGSNEIKTLFKVLGFIPGYNKKRIPEWVFRAPLDFRKAVLQGLMDSDGSYIDNRITLTNKKLIQDIKTLAEMSGISTSRNIKEIKRNNRKLAYRITVNLNKINNNVFSLENVCSIQEKQHKRDTYDLQVDNQIHNFIAEGIVTHNTMLEDAMLTYRIVRSPERRVFYIDVGNIPPNDVDSYMEAVKSTLRNQGNIDRRTGREDLRYNSQSLLDDYFIPVRGSQQGTKIDSLSGGQHVSATEDVEYIQRKLFSAMKVPKPYLNFDENLSAKASLAQMDIRFSRTISALQKIIIAELNKLAMIHLFVKGFDGADLINFELKLSNPSSVALQQKLELWSVKFDTAGAAKETKLVDEKWIQKNILELSPTEMLEIEKGLRKDKVREKELDDLDLTPSDPREQPKTTDIFDPSNYDNPAAIVPKNKREYEDYTTRNIGIDDFKNDIEYKSDLEVGKTPIKATPFLTRHRKNRVRRMGVGKGTENTMMPDMNSMLSQKNKYTKDVYGLKTESEELLKIRSLKELENKELIKSLKIEPQFDKQMTSVFNKLKDYIERTSNKDKLLTEELQLIDLNDIEIEQDGNDLLLEIVNDKKEVSSEKIEKIKEKTLADVYIVDDVDIE